jgi:hypothetical protein
MTGSGIHSVSYSVVLYYCSVLALNVKLFKLVIMHAHTHTHTHTFTHRQFEITTPDTEVVSLI